MPITKEYLAPGYEHLRGQMDVPQLEGGYFYPLSPSAKANVLGAPPYHFCGEEVVFAYQADPEAVRKFIPAPFEPSLENPGGCVLHVNSYVSKTQDDDKLLVSLPERCNYTETYLECRCRFQGKETKIYVYFWVDKDFSMVRGWLQASPKKFGETHVTFEKRHLFDMNPYFPQFGKGFEIGGVCSAHQEKMLAASCKLEEQIRAEEMHPDVLMGTHGLFIYPDFSMGYTGRALHKVVHNVTDTWYGEVWRCVEPKVEYFSSPVEEHDLLRPLRIDAAYYYTLGFTIYGHVVDFDLNTGV